MVNLYFDDRTSDAFVGPRAVPLSGDLPRGSHDWQSLEAVIGNQLGNLRCQALQLNAELRQTRLSSATGTVRGFSGRRGFDGGYPCHLLGATLTARAGC